jgi:hypothetical protein
VAASGGRSQLACLFAVAIFSALLLFGTGLLASIPRAALAGVLLLVGASIFRLHDMAQIWRQVRVEFLLMAVTLLLIVVLPIQQGMLAGIVLALVHGLYVLARPDTGQLARSLGRPCGGANGRRAGGAGARRACDRSAGSDLLYQCPLHLARDHGGLCRDAAPPAALGARSDRGHRSRLHRRSSSSWPAD